MVPATAGPMCGGQPPKGEVGEICQAGSQECSRRDRKVNGNPSDKRSNGQEKVIDSSASERSS